MKDFTKIQPYLIQPKMEQLLLDFAENKEHIITRSARFHIDHVKHNLSAMENLFAGYINARLNMYLKIL